MASYVIRRILQWIPILLMSSIMVFTVVRFLPGDAADVIAGPDATAEVVEQVRQAYGLDRSLPVQYVSWLKHMLQGDFGESYIYHLDNAELIFGRLPSSLLLACTALLIAVCIGIPAGLYAGYRERKSGDFFVSTGTAFAIATPDFWFGIVAILIFSVWLGWLPPGGLVNGFDSPGAFLASLLLPGFTLALHGTAILARFTRSATLETLSEDHVRTARAKGVSAFGILRRHVLRNSLVPVVTMMGILLGRMLGGAVVIESLFAWPGIGRLLVQSIISRDYGVVQGILIVLVLFFLVINLVVDLIYAMLDPRIRLTDEVAE